MLSVLLDLLLLDVSSYEEDEDDEALESLTISTVEFTLLQVF